MPDADTFPALSIRQPWADLILWDVKDIENRSWSTRFRGNLLVHAGRRVDRAAIGQLEDWFGVVLPDGYQPQTGAILGLVEIVDCVTRHPQPVLQRPLRPGAPYPDTVRPAFLCRLEDPSSTSTKCRISKVANASCKTCKSTACHHPLD